MLNRSYSREIKGNRFYFERVDKKTARRAYNNNLTVIFCPVNLSPFSPWGLDMPMNKENYNCNGIEFEKLINEFEFYNCNSETGRYTAFYIPVKYTDGFSPEPKPGNIKSYDYKYLEV